MLGLPGDFTPPSRFVRSALFTTNVLPIDTAKGAVLQVFHLLNNFDIPKGSVTDQSQGKPMHDSTQWTSANDLKNKRFHFRTYADSTIRMVDLMTFDLDAKDIKIISMQGETLIKNVSRDAKNLSKTS